MIEVSKFSKGLCYNILSWIRNAHLGFLSCLIGRSRNEKDKLRKPYFPEGFHYLWKLLQVTDTSQYPFELVKSFVCLFAFS